MILNRIATACLMASVSLGATQRAAADGDALVGGLIGGIIGGVIVNEANKGARHTTTRRTVAAPAVSSATREANREVQVALNYFGFPVGTPDGSLGPKSRAAISSYQATLGYPATGQLTDYERTLLVNSYYRGLSGGALTAQQAATNPMGMRGLLLTYRDEMAGVSTQPAAAAPPVLAAVAPAPQPAAPAPALPVIAAAPNVAAPESA